VAQAEESMLSNKRSVIGAASPLEHAGILLHVLNILGPGHHLCISAVSKAWRESYGRLASVQKADLTYDYYDKVALCTITQ
jgi:predicted secreted protein